MTTEIAAKRKVCRCAPDCRERIECERAGEPGHSFCGWCDTCNRAKHNGCPCPTTPPGSNGATHD